jgi:5-carboxyvanillate decarboxylase
LGERKVKIIATEEHFTTQEYLAYLRARKVYPYREYFEVNGKKLEKDWWSETGYLTMDPARPDRSLEVGEGRLKDMDEAGIAMQVISFVGPNVGRFDPKDAIAMARKRNDKLAKIVETYPSRFAGFADVAPQNFEAAPRELERAVKELGLKGVMVPGHIDDDYLDNRKYWPIFAMAEKMDVPVYLHPEAPLPSMIKPYMTYPGLALAVWGYAAEAGLHAMRLILSGLFDSYPNLKIILGHMGESIPFWLWRMDGRWLKQKQIDPNSAEAYKNFKKTPSQYFKDNFYVTISGMYWEPALEFVCKAVGTDRILFASDYPHEDTAEAVRFIKSAKISELDREKICHLNAEKLFKL